MQKETVTVVILEGGKTCKEVNPYGEKPKQATMVVASISHQREARIRYNDLLNAWNLAELKLRTWEVANVEYHAGNPLVYVFDKDANGKIFKLLEPEETFKAQIINGKAVIV